MQRDFKVITFNNSKNSRKMKATATLAYSSKFINRNYLIKVSGVDAQGNRVHKLVGVRGIIELIGIDMLNKLLNRAAKCIEDVCVCKLRRGLKVSFYYK